MNKWDEFEKNCQRGKKQTAALLLGKMVRSKVAKSQVEAKFVFKKAQQVYAHENNLSKITFHLSASYLVPAYMPPMLSAFLEIPPK